MADFRLVPETPLISPALPQGPVPAGVSVFLQNHVALASIIVRKGRTRALSEAVQARFDLTLPVGPKSVVADGVRFIGVAPGQWLSVAADGRDLAGELAQRLGSVAAITDQSDSRALIRLQGPKARACLAKGLPIDLHPRKFGPGDAALTVMALFAVHLWQCDDRPSFELLVSRSMAGDFLHLLIANAAEYGVSLSVPRDSTP